MSWVSMVGAALAGVLFLAACGSDDDSGGSGGGGSSSASGDTGSMVIFMPPSSVPYAASFQKAAKAEAQAKGWDIKITSNNFDQNEQNSQVRQQIASGEKPSVYVWWPSDAKAGFAALRELNATGVPIIMANQQPNEDEKKLIKAYAGVDDKLLGENNGKFACMARDAMKKDGMTLHSEGGNFLVIGGPPGYPASVLRMAETTKNAEACGMTMIGETTAGFDPTVGYKFGSPLINRTKSKGIDVIASITDFTTPGVIRALEENGLAPGKDLYLVSATCSKNSLKQLETDQEYVTGIQPPETEGKLAVDVAIQAAQGKVEQFDNFMPTATITKKELDTYELEGQSFEELCSQA